MYKILILVLAVTANAAWAAYHPQIQPEPQAQPANLRADECPICFIPLEHNNNISLPCFATHRFDTQCLRRLIQRAHDEHVEPLCPYCSAPVNAEMQALLSLPDNEIRYTDIFGGLNVRNLEYHQGEAPQAPVHNNHANQAPNANMYGQAPAYNHGYAHNQHQQGQAPAYHNPGYHHVPQQQYAQPPVHNNHPQAPHHVQGQAPAYHNAGYHWPQHHHAQPQVQNNQPPNRPPTPPTFNKGKIVAFTITALLGAYLCYLKYKDKSKQR